MKTKFVIGLALGAASLTLHLNAQANLQDTRDVLGRWVETKQIISEENANWRVEESILKDTKNLLSSELERLNKALEDMEATATAADEERSQLADQKEKLTAASAVVESNIGSLETQIKTIVKTLPQPLVEKLKPLIRRLPDDPNKTELSLGERVQNIVGILSQADKFNTTITLSNESREMETGKVVQVTTLYWGLAMAYFVDNSGSYAGLGTPSAEGWVWKEVSGAGAQIKQLLDIYEGTEEIQFVEVPASIN
ncbi:MAG: DUF3450 domain-containing protein [Opitutales bacterium]|jgi:hypothetical protein|nr:DUF3450 domain-containing protein [Opitutales bacterium]MDP4645226.1 DUF3450 domain-containing protein [Opitutales bacterium]MDP4778289.1 DUF3450 domain-containing protein [Opitutales bacterium]MDP4878744.1 DUF3450 domain-containing protein [Opitutales bacterium]MDP4884525.1 DUF3450 domain-containing protein [Opitutales bacterium]